MKTLGRPLLTALVAGALGSSLPAQQNPGLSAQPTGRTLEEPVASPVEQPVDLSQSQPAAVSLELTTKEEAFFARAMRGEAWAQTQLGKIYITAGGDEARLRQGIDLLRSAAAQNDAEAIYLLATMTAAGAGMAQSDVEAFQQMKLAADLGFADAQFVLASMYLEGRGTINDPEAGIQWGRKAAQNGHAAAKYAVALELLKQQQDGQDTREAVGWLESAAKDGHREAVFFLAGAIAHGDYGLEKDERKAAEMAFPRAEAGDPEFQFALATLYLRTETFVDQRAEGWVWLEKAAKSGQQDAQRMLAEKNTPAWP